MNQLSKRGGKREGAGRKPDIEVQKLRADLKKSMPVAMNTVNAILADTENPNHFACVKWVVDKLIPNLKPESAPIEFDMTGDTPADQARSIVEAAAQGKLSPSAATELLASLASCMKIIELSDFEQRLIAIEEQQDK